MWTSNIQFGDRAKPNLNIEIILFLSLFLSQKTFETLNHFNILKIFMYGTMLRDISALLENQERKLMVLIFSKFYTVHRRGKLLL